MRALWTMVLAALITLGFGGCADELDQPIGDDFAITVAAQQGGPYCLTSNDCPGDRVCSNEAGDCLTPPWCKAQPCPAVCYGRCQNLEACGDVICPAGTVCCNPLLSICTAPDEFCIM